MLSDTFLIIDKHRYPNSVHFTDAVTGPERG